MLIKNLQGLKEPMAEITFPGPTFPVIRATISLVLGRAVPADEFLGDDIIRIFAAHKLVHCVTIHDISTGT